MVAANDGDIMASVIHNTTNNTIQAPNCAGYAIFKCCNVILTIFSIMAKKIAPASAFGNPFVVTVDAVAPPRCNSCTITSFSVSIGTSLNAALKVDGTLDDIVVIRDFGRKTIPSIEVVVEGCERRLPVGLFAVLVVARQPITTTTAEQINTI